MDANLSTSGQELRQALCSVPLIPYEKWTSTALSGAVGNAERILNDGWERSGHPAVRLSDPLPWDEFSATARSWNFLLNCFDLLDDLLSAHRLTGNERYLSPAVRVALDWIRKHPSVEESEGAHAWYDMAVGMRAYRLAYILDAGAREDWVSDEDLALMMNSLEQHRVELSDDDKICFHNNHGFYQVAGQLAMARRLGAHQQNMRDSAEQAKTRLLAMLERQFSEEGVHTEHSPDYHRMVYETLKGIVDAGLLEDERIGAKIDLIEESLSWFVMPDGYLANFGDSDYRSCSRTPRQARDKWRTERMQYAVTAGQLGAPPQDSLRTFPQSGYFVVKKRHETEPEGSFADATYLAQIAAFVSRTHKHADDLSFIWYDRGASILVDSGRFGYVGKTEQGSELWKDGFWYSNPNRVYCESTRAHNTVEIDRRNYARKGIKPYGSALLRWGQTSSGLYFSECGLKHYKSIRHVRLLVLKPYEWLVVYDWLHDNVEKDHDYRQWFHFAPELSLRLQGDQYVALVGHSKEKLHVASLLAAARPGKPIIAQEAPRLQGWWSPKDRTMLPSYAAAFEQRGRTANFATLFAFTDKLEVEASSRAAPSGRNGHLRWRASNGRHTLAFSRPEEGPIALDHKVDK